MSDTLEQDHDVMLHSLPLALALPTSDSLEKSEPPGLHQEEQFPKGVKLAMLFIAACLCLVLTELDIQVVATVIPAVTETFKTSADVAWYSSTYRLALCSLQFMFGRLYRTWPLKTIFLPCLVIFEIGSAICGAAPTSAALIAGRVISGIGASGVFAGCWQILTVSFPLRYRPIATGIAAGVEGISGVAGPVIGGILTTYLSWRWCFYINLPVGAVVLLLLIFFLDNPPIPPPNAHLRWREKELQTDPIGTAVLILSVCCLFVALQYGAIEYGWRDKRVITLFVTSGILTGAFVWIQWKRQDAATLPPRIIRRRSILAGFWFSLCVNSAINVVTYYLPAYLQVVNGMSAAKAGLWMMPMLGGMIFILVCAGPGISWVGFYSPFMLATSIVLPIASGLLTTLHADGPRWQLILYEFLFGMGAGIGFQAPQVAVQTILSDADVSMGLNIIVFAQNFGPALFVTVAQSLLTSRLVSNFEGIPGFGLKGNELSSLSLSDIKGLVPAGELGTALSAHNDAITQTFYLAVGLACATVIGSLTMEWRSVKEKKA